MKVRVRVNLVVLQHAYSGGRLAHVWSSITSSGLSIKGLSSLTSQQEVGKAEMLPPTTATNPYYLPVVIVPVLVLCLRLSIKVCKSMLPVSLPLRCHIQDLSLAVVVKTCWPEVHSTRNYCNYPFLSWLAFLLIQVILVVQQSDLCTCHLLPYHTWEGV